MLVSQNKTGKNPSQVSHLNFFYMQQNVGGRADEKLARTIQSQTYCRKERAQTSPRPNSVCSRQNYIQQNWENATILHVFNWYCYGQVYNAVYQKISYEIKSFWWKLNKYNSHTSTYQKGSWLCWLGDQF